MKKLFSILCVVLMCFTLVNFNLSAQNDEEVPTEDSTEYRKFTHTRYTFLIWQWDAIFCAQTGGNCLPEVVVTP
jgi:hypothetical protein